MVHADITTIAKLICAARTGVGFTGAGISTDSGIPDFRSPGGVWAKYQPVYFDEFIASSAARYRYWLQKCEGHVEIATAEPNSGHRTLVDWEKAGYLRGVVTQNIDGLHELAGTGQILELHGNARKVACLDCDFLANADDFVAEFLARDRVPDCPQCGGLLKHATISFGQTLPQSVLQTAVQWSESADLVSRTRLLSGGDAGGGFAATGSRARGRPGYHQSRPNTVGRTRRCGHQ